MTIRNRSTKQHATTHHATQSNHDTTTHEKEMSTMNATDTNRSSTESVPVNPNPSPSLSATAAQALYVQPPPTDVVLPVTPKTADRASSYRQFKPTGDELESISGAVVELQGFTDYAATIGKTAPPHEQLVQMFDAASKWSTMRTSAAAWLAYCSRQEGAVWEGVRAQMARIKPAFALAAQGEPTLAQRFPKLAKLLGAKTVIAKKSVSTKRMNKQARANGEPEVHGAVGKKRRRAAEKAALAQAATPPAPPPAEGAKPEAPVAPAATPPAATPVPPAQPPRS